MTTADKTPPSADETAEYAEGLLATLTRFLGNEDSARTVRETTLEQARVGNALRGVSEEVLEGYLKRVCGRMARFRQIARSEKSAHLFYF